MDRTASLRADHACIRVLADRLGEALAKPSPPDAVQFLLLRREFGRAVTRHLKVEDWVLYPRLRLSRRPEIREVAERLCAEVGAFEAAFGAYARRWTSLHISMDWLGYRADTVMMLERLRRRMALEEEVLYPLLEREPGAAGLTGAARAPTSTPWKSSTCPTPNGASA